ncbi:10316_t:CDS:2 [Entrophospora sp. SA101]|nr:10316_t:CDS:2 [Entrophospora sp. SA101]
MYKVHVKHPVLDTNEYEYISFILYTPETAEIHTLAKTVELDGCISALKKLSISITNTNLIAATDKLDQNMQILVQPHHSGSISRKANALVGELDKVNELKNKKLLNKQQETEIDKQQRIS